MLMTLTVTNITYYYYAKFVKPYVTDICVVTVSGMGMEYSVAGLG